jgi:ectoine hydroxylase-related dioxygenase (phytanoyl-CoA dioxygenase family)
LVDPTSGRQPGVFTGDQIEQAEEFFAANGYATISGLFGDAELAAAENELVEAQRTLAEGVLDARHATDILDEDSATIEGRPFAHYVCFATQISPRADGLVHHPVLVDATARLLGPQAWLLDYEQFGIVYQDARPDPGSAYSRIGWHTDHQSGPHLDVWPAVAFTIHFDPTSPANGFLRVLPGSHLGGVEGIPPGFERVPGEVAVYQERGDVLLHHADLWHGAARGTADGEAAVRRHLRGSWHGGAKLEVGHGTDDFVKNALR